MPVIIRANSGVQAYGMSITAGQSAQNAPNYWVNRFGAFIGGTITNRAIGGTGLLSMVEQSNKFSGYSGRLQPAVIDGPLNDIRQGGSLSLPSIRPALDAMLSNLFSGYFRGPQWGAPFVTKTGAWSSLGASYGGRSALWSGYSPQYTNDPNASISFQFFGSTVAIHGFLSSSDDWQDWRIEIDNASFGTTDCTFKARPGVAKQCGAHVIRGLSDTQHVLKLSPPLAGIPAGKICVIDGIQTPMINAPVILGTIPNIASWSQYGSVGTWTDAQIANDIIEDTALAWNVDGFPVNVASVDHFIDPARDFSSDGIHPTDRGHLNWALAYLSSIRISNT